jgi:hypothetical protein
MVDKELISTTEMQKFASTKGGHRCGQIYQAYDSTYGEVKAMFVKTVGVVGVAGSPMYPKTGSFTVAADFLCDDNEDGAGVCGEERCLGSWLGGITTAAGYGFVQIYGLNLVALTTDGGVAAKDTILPTDTDGTWEGINSDVLVTAGTNNPATRCGFTGTADTGTALAAGLVFWDVHLPTC